jgi:hypothetical protein
MKMQQTDYGTEHIKRFDVNNELIFVIFMKIVFILDRWFI